MRKLILTYFLALMALAQKPVGKVGDYGHFLDYYILKSGGPGGDTNYFSAWAADAMLPLFPDPTGLPILGTANDGVAGSCSGDVMLIQLSKLPSPTTTPTTGNTQITNLTNCLTGIQDHGTSKGWAGEYTTGDGAADATWKGAVMAFRSNHLLMPLYRQDHSGTQWGDSTMDMSPDAGQTFVDYGRWSLYTVTAATCSSTTASVSATNLLSSGAKIYVHDITPAGYNGQHTLSAASGSTVSWTVANCTGLGSGTAFGAFGPLDSAGSGPFGPGNGGYNMMWPLVSGSNPMQWQMIINYGQDGSYPSGIETGCDPTVYVCGLATNRTLYSRPVVLFRFPVLHELDKSLYEWYTCATYVTAWPTTEGTCDGNRSSSWTSTLASATPVYYDGSLYGDTRPDNTFTVTYLPSHQSYVTSNLAYAGGNEFKFSEKWAPHPWGPWYNLHNTTAPANDTTQWPGFYSLMGYGMVTTTTPPNAKVVVSGNVNPGAASHPSGGSSYFRGAEFGLGRVPVTGAARRGDYLEFGQLNMGHRFTSGVESGAVSRQGAGYKLDWWSDFFDHGGDIAATTRPFFQDLLSGGARSFGAWNTFPYPNFNFGATTLAADGVGLFGPGHNGRLESSFNDTVLSANSGNASWTFIAVFKITAAPGTGGVQNGGSRGIPILGYGTQAVSTSASIWVGWAAPGDIAVCPQGSWGNATSCVIWNATPVTSNTWYFLAVSAKANETGIPTITAYLGSAGVISEVGGASLATAANGTVINGLRKSCSSCSATPAITAQAYELGYNANIGGGPENPDSLNGVYGEAGMYSGAVPSHVIREMYKSIKADWARVGRGVL